MFAHHNKNGRNKADKKNTDNLVSDIQETRSRICTTFLITIAAIAIPSLAASLYRITEVGWQPIMGVHIVIAVALWTVFFFRSWIPYNYKAGFIVAIFLIIGLGGMFQFGLFAAGTVFLVVSSPIATLFFGGRIGLATMLLTFCGAVMICLLTVSGHIKYGFDLATYAVAPASWLNSIIGWGLASTALTVSLHVFKKT